MAAQPPSTIAAILGIGDGSSVIRFAQAVRVSSLRTSPVTSVALYRTPKPNKHFNHRFILATVCIRTEQHPSGINSYIRIEFAKDDLIQGQFSSQKVQFSDSHSSLTRWCNSLAKMVVKPTHKEQGLSLDALASLLEIVHTRISLHDMTGHIRQWLTNLIIMACAREYRDSYIAGHIWSMPLNWYMNGKSDAEHCNKQLWTDDPTIRWVSQKVSSVRRGRKVRLTHDVEARSSPMDEEIRLVLESWNPRLPPRW